MVPIQVPGVLNYGQVLCTLYSVRTESWQSTNNGRNSLQYWIDSDSHGSSSATVALAWLYFIAVIPLQ